MDLQVSLFAPTIEGIAEEMTREPIERLVVSERYDSLTSCYVLTKNNVWILQISIDYSIEPSILLRLDRKKIKPRTIDQVFSRKYVAKEKKE